MDNRDKFYIFLDIDGVMFDWNYIKSNYSQDEIHGTIKHFDPQSVNALNSMINCLRDEYRVQLVISSTWKYNMHETLNVLSQNGVMLDLCDNVSSTEISENPNLRELEVLQYLDEDYLKGNYAIIDDEDFNYLKFFDNKKIIKTNIVNGDLNQRDVDCFLEENNLLKFEEF